MTTQRIADHGEQPLPQAFPGPQFGPASVAAEAACVVHVEAEGARRTTPTHPRPVRRPVGRGIRGPGTPKRPARSSGRRPRAGSCDGACRDPLRITRLGRSAQTRKDRDHVFHLSVLSSGARPGARPFGRGTPDLDVSAATVSAVPTPGSRSRAWSARSLRWRRLPSRAATSPAERIVRALAVNADGPVLAPTGSAVERPRDNGGRLRRRAILGEASGDRSERPDLAGGAVDECGLADPGGEREDVVDGGGGNWKLREAGPRNEGAMR